MSSLKKLLRYYDTAKEYVKLSDTFNDVIVEIPEDTVISVTFQIDGSRHFRTREFPISDLPGITEKLKAKVSDIMSRNVSVLTEDNTLDDVMKLMYEKNIHTLPVVKDGKIIGIVGRRDLAYNCF